MKEKDGEREERERNERERWRERGMKRFIEILMQHHIKSGGR